MPVWLIDWFQYALQDTIHLPDNEIEADPWTWWLVEQLYTVSVWLIDFSMLSSTLFTEECCICVIDWFQYALQYTIHWRMLYLCDWLISVCSPVHYSLKNVVSVWLIDFSMLSSTLFTEEDLQDHEIEAEPELWVGAGNSYAVPVSIKKDGTFLKWEFTTYPKVSYFHSAIPCNHTLQSSLLIG